MKASILIIIIPLIGLIVHIGNLAISQFYLSKLSHEFKQINQKYVLNTSKDALVYPFVNEIYYTDSCNASEHPSMLILKNAETKVWIYRCFDEANNRVRLAIGTKTF
ncbi:MAG: hypothetical protein VW397_00015 [Candidatus Margulisiibacteriota bacterium]